MVDGHSERQLPHVGPVRRGYSPPAQFVRADAVALVENWNENRELIDVDNRAVVSRSTSYLLYQVKPSRWSRWCYSELNLKENTFQLLLLLTFFGHFYPLVLHRCDARIFVHVVVQADLVCARIQLGELLLLCVLLLCGEADRVETGGTLFTRWR